MEITIFDENRLAEMPKGLYLALLHGRDSKTAVLQDKGFNGPLIGPLVRAYTVGGDLIILPFVREEDEDIYVEEGVVGYEGYPCLHVVDGLVECQGKYYGDWTVFFNYEGK